MRAACRHRCCRKEMLSGYARVGGSVIVMPPIMSRTYCHKHSPNAGGVRATYVRGSRLAGRKATWESTSQTTARCQAMAPVCHQASYSEKDTAKSSLCSPPTATACRGPRHTRQANQRTESNIFHFAPSAQQHAISPCSTTAGTSNRRARQLATYVVIIRTVR